LGTQESNDGRESPSTRAEVRRSDGTYLIDLPTEVEEGDGGSKSRAIVLDDGIPSDRSFLGIVVDPWLSASSPLVTEIEQR
jgi:hypothetical protein